MLKLLYGFILLFAMSQVAGVAVDLALNDLQWQIEEMPKVHPQVKTLMKSHGVQFFDWNEERQEYGFYRNGRWCPAK